MTSPFKKLEVHEQNLYVLTESLNNIWLFPLKNENPTLEPFLKGNMEILYITIWKGKLVALQRNPTTTFSPFLISIIDQREERKGGRNNEL